MAAVAWAWVAIGVALCVWAGSLILRICASASRGVAGGHAGAVGRLSGLWKKLRGDRGQAIVEFVIILVAFLGLFFGGISLMYGYGTSVATTDAARAAARLAAIECGQGSSTWFQDAQQAAYDDLVAARLPVDLTPTSSVQSSPAAGEWDFSANCSSTQATVDVQYDSPTLFPSVLVLTGLNHPQAFTEQSSVTFPVE